MVRKLFLSVVLVLTASLHAQVTDVTIHDSSGNLAAGTISNGNVYFLDSQGHMAYGTIRDGSVFLNTGQGQITFGTISNGNVFLTDPKGISTGTIQNGNIYIHNSDGSTTTGSYDSFGNVNTNTSPSAEDRRRTLERQRQIDQQNYAAGAAVGDAIGTGIAAAVANHRINSYCKSNPTSTYHTSTGLSIPCPNSPLNSWEQQQIADYCADNPGLWIIFGKHRVDCYTAPNPPNLKWAIWEMQQWKWNYTRQKKKAVIAQAISGDQLRADWSYWKVTYCSLAPGSKYKDLDGKKQHCQ